jgi:uncharacterized membrane protein YdjX (TVP38/TMEM64 family)
MTQIDCERGSGQAAGRQRTALIAALLVALAVLVASIIVWHRPLLTFFGDRERVADFIRRWGVWAPLVTIGLQILQVVVTPIPGQVLDVVNGCLFGPLWGTVYSTVGMLIGSFLAMGLARRFGRLLAERLVSRQALERLDRYSCSRGPLFFLVFFLMPFVPNDVACFLAGLTPIPLAELMLIVLVGRMPSIVVSNLVGATMTELTLPQMAVFAAGALLLALTFRRYQARIETTLLAVTTHITDKLKSRGAGS